MREIRDIVKAAGLPVAKRSSDDALLIRVAKGRRANTPRKHVKTWKKASRWMDAAFGQQWPGSPECFAEFIEAMVEEPCSRSFPESVYKALIVMFLEYAERCQNPNSYAGHQPSRMRSRRPTSGCNRWS